METVKSVEAKTKQKSTQELISSIGEIITARVPKSEVLRLQNNGKSHNEALRQVMREISDRDNSEPLPESERSILAIVAELGTFAEASHAVSQIDASGKHTTTLDHTARKLKSDYIIPFNHATKDLINAHPNEGIDSMSTALTYLYEKLYAKGSSINPKELAHQSKPTANDVMHEVSERLNGMRHEVAAWTMLDLAGFEIDDDVSVEEDKRGLDIVIIENGQPLYIDIKSSEQAARNARPKTGIRTVYTGLVPKDFTGQSGTGTNCLGISFDTALQKCDSFAEAIHQNQPIPRTTRGIGQSASRNI